VPLSVFALERVDLGFRCVEKVLGERLA